MQRDDEEALLGARGTKSSTSASAHKTLVGLSGATLAFVILTFLGVIATIVLVVYGIYFYLFDRQRRLDEILRLLELLVPPQPRNG